MIRGQRNADGGRQQRVGPVGKLVRGLATGIGLATESYQHHKKKSASRAAVGDDAEDDAAGAEGELGLEDQAHLSHEMDEAVWELDEAQDQLADHETAASSTSTEDLPDLANSFIRDHPPPPYEQQGGEDHSGQLALPVVITQRRPGSRTRGFVQAYSPLLADVGIDQATFLHFLDNLNKSVQPSPWIQAINLASFAGNGVPEPFTMIISMAVKRVTDASSELHSRSKTNKFLDQVNESFFAPRGLVALIMTWKPSRQGEMLTMAEFNMESSIAQASTQGQQRSRFESSSGASSFEWPETAPLVFPVLDELVDSGSGAGEAKKQSAIKRGGNFVWEYMDKRARATWAGENPDSSMANATGQEQFSSRYADPNHPASSGDPIALLTGGFLQSPLASRRRGGGLGRGRGADSRGGLLGGVRGGSARSDDAGVPGRGRLGSSRRGGGIVGSGIGPVHLIRGARKFVAGRTVLDDCAAADGRANGGGNGTRASNGATLMISSILEQAIRSRRRVPSISSQVMRLFLLPATALHRGGMPPFIT